MPRTWNDKYIPSKADLNVKMLTNAEIGGIGKIQYRLLKFNKYKMEQINGENAFYTFPTYDDKENGKIVHMSGKEILISLYNLAKNIDSYDVKEPFSEQILKWCETVCNPYGLEHIQSYLDNEIKEQGEFVVLAKDRHFYFQFEIRNFMQDLNDLYSNFGFPISAFIFSINSQILLISTCAVFIASNILSSGNSFAPASIIATFSAVPATVKVKSLTSL